MACDNKAGVSTAGRALMRMGDWAFLIEDLLKTDAGSSTLITAAGGAAPYRQRSGLELTE